MRDGGDSMFQKARPSVGASVGWPSVLIVQVANGRSDINAKRMGAKVHQQLHRRCSVVSRPTAPLHLMAGGEIPIYVRTPLWVRVEVGESAKVLREIPTVRLSDSWFGPNTVEGELCYASPTIARITMANVTPRPDRAVTRVLIRNDSGKVKVFEQLSLPVPYLALFASENDELWTQDVTLTSARNGKTVEVKVGKDTPMATDNAKRISEPRQRLERNTLTMGWSLIFG